MWEDSSELGSRSALLRFWRTEIAGRGLEAAARAAGVASATTVHNWETGKAVRGPTSDQVELLDRYYDAGGALADLFAALRTPDALEPSTQWWNNFQGESRPCWAWLRSSSGSGTRAVAEVGPFSVSVDVPARTGVFLQARAFVANPPVRVTLDDAGWVDFGYGLLPSRLSAPVVEANQSSLIGPRGDLDPALAQARGWWLASEFGRGWFAELRHRLGARVDAVREVVTSKIRDGLGAPTDLRDAAASRDSVARHWDGHRYERLRVARGLSLDSAAALANRLKPARPVSRDSIHRLETAAATRPSNDQLPSLLDTVYRADGRTCCTAVPARPEGRRTVVEFPEYWVGPVWVQFLRRSGPVHGDAQLRWAPWFKPLRVRDGTVVTCRRSERSSKPLEVRLPEGWDVLAGVGVHDLAIDVNEGWGFIDIAAARAALTRYWSVLEEVMRPAR